MQPFNPSRVYIDTNTKLLFQAQTASPSSYFLHNGSDLNSAINNLQTYCCKEIIMGRAPCCEKSNGLKKGPWTPEEDQKLTHYIQIHGPGNWRTLPKNAGLERCGKSCRLRWTNYLRPDIKRGRFSFEEEEAIIQLHSVLGNKWSAIATRLPGRTDNEIKNYWNTHIRKRLLRSGIDPVTHTPRIDLFRELTTLLKLNHPALCNQNALLNLSNLLSLNQQTVNPQLVNIATSLLTLKQPQESTAFLQPNIFQNPNMAQFQQFPSYPSTVNYAQQLMQGGDINTNIPGAVDISSKVGSFKSSPMSSQDTGSPLDLEGHFGSGLMSNNYGCQPNLSSNSSFQSSLDNSNQQKQYSLDSILSTPNNQSTEEERDAYCSNLFNFEIPEGLDMSYLL
uniref:Uncharacterized protein n=1 Tax=Kalanchoe fedtschenkoi TaxID=63787 RepID=A0A7N0TJR0_KALFE